MAKASNKTATIVVDDNASIGHNSSTRILDVAFDCGKSLAGSDGALVDLIRSHRNNETMLASMQTAFYEGYCASRLKIDRLAAKAMLALAKHNYLLPEKNTSANRTADQERVYGAARVNWSRALGIVDGPKKKDKPGKPATPAGVTVSHPSKVTVEALVVEKAAKPEDVRAHMALLITHLRRYQALNAAYFKGDDGAAFRDWMMQAPVL